MSVSIHKLPVEGAKVYTGKKFSDDRGFFYEAYNSNSVIAANEQPKKFEQISVSQSKANVLRGIHCSAYGKTVSCLAGSLYDFVVDLREGSPSYLQWSCVHLTAENMKQLYVPAGCGHGFISGEDGCTITYFQEGTYDPAADRNVAWNDATLNIKWPIPEGVTPIISDKDQAAKPLVPSAVATTTAARKRLLVVGASGQVGAALLQSFSDYVTVGTYCGVQTDASLVHCNLEQAAESTDYAKQMITMSMPDVVAICGAFTWVDGCESDLTKAYAINATGPANIATAAAAIGAKVVYYSSDYVFDGSAGPYDETATPNPASVYGKSKLEGERLVTLAAPDAIIVRTTGVYGPETQQKNFVNTLIKQLSSAGVTSFPVPSDQIATPTYNKDIAAATRALVNKGAAGIFNVVGPALMSRHAFATEVATLLKLDTAKLSAVETKNLGQKAPRPLAAGLTLTKLQATLPDFKPHSVADALADWNPHVMSYYATTQATGNVAQKKVWYAPHTFEAYGEEEIRAVEQCLRAGWLAPGPITAEFEQRVSTYFGKACGIMVNSGSSANMVGLSVLNLPKGSEVVTPACTFSTSIAPMEQIGVKPVFCDVEIGRYVPSIEQVLEKITDKTSCIFIPNLIGSKIDWAGLRARLPRKDIWLFEDSCDTMTCTPDTDVASISFYASHIITAGGCGGVVMFKDPAFHSKALMYRDWGRIGNNSEDVTERFGHEVDGIPYDFKFLYAVHGYNFKCSEMNAAFGVSQMKKLPHFTKLRKDNIRRYVTNLTKANASYILPIDFEKYDWLAFPLTIAEGKPTTERMDLLRYLEERDVQVRVCFAGNITRHPAYRNYLQEFEASDAIMARSFLLGAHHGLTFEDIDRVCDLLIRFDKGLSGPKHSELAAAAAAAAAKK